MKYKNIAICTKTSYIQEKEYYRCILISDYSSVEEAMTVATEITKEQGKYFGGVTVVFFDKIEDFRQIPTHHYDEETGEYLYTEYHNEWSERLGIADNTRLVLWYIENLSDVDKVIKSLERH